MKVGELREKLSKLKKEEVVKIASEFYKLIPKAKKEDYNVDEMVNNPSSTKKKKVSATKTMSLDEIETDVKLFIEHAKEQYYLYSNKVIPKKERSTWRFKVKRWYKELTNVKRPDANLERQAEILTDLYELLCESCGYNYFSAFDTFQSIGVEQDDFYRSVITLLQESKGKAATVEKCVRLITDNHLGPNTMYYMLMNHLLETYPIPDLKYKAIEIIEQLLKENNFTPKITNKKFYIPSREQFTKEMQNNDLTRLGLRLYLALFEIDNGIEFYQKHYYDRNSEIKLYIMIDILLEKKQKKSIITEINKAIDNGIEPRKSLMKLKKIIEETDELPQYMPSNH